MSSPIETVNSIMEWLNSLFGLRIPTLPLTGWPSVMKKLWNMFVSESPPFGSPPTWVIPIEGTLDGVLPAGSTLQLEHLQIHVKPSQPSNPC
jgi:hypothetical protein